jgi:L-asparaginase II
VTLPTGATPDTSDAYEPVAVTVRSGHTESVHHGALVVLDSSGQVVVSVGRIDVPIYPRSAMKPLQATAMVEAGLDLPADLLALACASHDGHAEHVAAARAILSRAGLDDSALANTADLPLDPAQAEAVLRAGGTRSAVQMNCSGKHAAMLLTCVTNAWSHDAGYLAVDHPLQQRITDTVARLAGDAPSHIGIDGCGAPAHVVPLIGLARAFASVASGAAGTAGRDVHRAMTTHPTMVGGPTNGVTRFMVAVPGLMVKDGAEGVYAAALPDGRAVALKVADGSTRARQVVLAAGLRALGIGIDTLDPSLWTSPLLGHGARVGEVRLVGRLAG